MPKFEIQKQIVSFCPFCGAKYVSPQPEENETHITCQDDTGFGCGAEYIVRKLN